MRSVKVVPKPFLQELSSNPLLYADCPIEVRRQIWETDPNLFKTEALPLLKNYSKTHQQNIPSISISPLLGASKSQYTFEPPRKRRQANTVLRQLMGLIGDNFNLYDNLLGLVKNLYVETKEIGYCTLRSDLLMSFSDSGMNEVAERDPCKKFTSLLDSSVHDGWIDNARASELAKLMGARKMSNPVMGDLGMIARDPFIVGVVLSSLWGRINNYLITNELLPRDDPTLSLFVKLLHAGLNSRFHADSIKLFFLFLFIIFIFYFVVFTLLNQTELFF
eukprot:TRINITY_DN9732_c0_g1_i1.p1 TRINITY_DN9732_c0_g1~~TRINITY_DN9732_c0_g1_i1.p1  ORF type:complete len:277 (-),score=47.66 TRINITY_DN9732_c0_g1_i1:743-1573(-)